MTQPSPVAGCIMADSLYVKPNGDLPCWDDVGEELILRTLDEDKLIAGEEAPIVNTPELVDMRRAFRAGKAPHPAFCSKCAVYGHGVARSLRPKILNVLHVEPAFLCQLACPQCFLPKERLALKGPPYYMTLDFYRALLDQLLREGIRRIRFVHFEGRGEPLLNPSLGEMAAATKERFPDSLVMATSHGNFPYRSWMHTSGMDILRFSVDGAFAESYERYRVGGKLEKALDLMRAIRDHGPEYPNSRLRVEWKYILFEWNDSDEEMRLAHRLAQELGVRLRFCLTHTPGRSLRFADRRGLLQTLDSMALDAGTESTFQLRRDPSEANAEDVFAEHAEALLLEAIDTLHSGEGGNTLEEIPRALRHAPGLERFPHGDWLDGLDTILERSRHPSTLVAMANVALAQHRWNAAERLFRRYLEMAPHGMDRQRTEAAIKKLAPHRQETANPGQPFKAKIEALLAEALQSQQRGHGEPFAPLIARVLRLDPGIEVAADEDWLDKLHGILEYCRQPSTLVALANIALTQQRWMAAERLFRRYLDLAPEAEDRAKTEEVLIDLAIGNRLGCGIDNASQVSPERRLEAERVALELDSSVPDHVLGSATPTVSHLEVIRRNAGAKTLDRLARLRRASGDPTSAGYLLASPPGVRPAST